MSIEQYLTFRIRDEEYAVAILRVREIIEYETVTRVPTTPAHIRGVINLRGAVLPVVDLAAKFGHIESALTRTTCIVVVETSLRGDAVVVGLLTDAVSQVIDITADQIEPPPAFGTHIRVDFLVGMAKIDGRLALVLDLDRVLSPVELQETLAAADEVPIESELSLTEPASA
jgi:purine-binding chemotaxis protein CheW